MWNIFPPHHRQSDTHLNTHKLHIPSGPASRWAQRYLQERLPVRQSVPMYRDPGAGLLHGSKLSWQLNNWRPTGSQSLQPKIPPHKSPSEKAQPPKSRAPQLGHQQNARHLFWKKNLKRLKSSKEPEQNRTGEYGSLQSALQQGGKISSSLAW